MRMTNRDVEAVGDSVVRWEVIHDTIPIGITAVVIIVTPNIKLDIRRSGSFDHEFLFTIFVLFHL